MTKGVPIIGEGISAAASAALQAAFDAAAIDARCEPSETAPDQLEERVAALRGDDAHGALVCRPHRETAGSLLDAVEGDAARAGAVSAIVRDGERLIGQNPEIAAFARALENEGGLDPKGKRAAVLGAGGAARAVCLALVDAGAATVLVVARTPRRADRLVAHLRGLTKAGTTITWCHWDDGTFLTFVPRSDIIVSCRPLESGDELTVREELIAPHAVVFELAEAAETPLLRAAANRGARTVPGSKLLVYQAAEAFRLLTGQEPPLEAMLAAGRAS